MNPHLDPLSLARRRRNIRKEHLSLGHVNRLGQVDSDDQPLTAENLSREFGPRPLRSNWPSIDDLIKKGFIPSQRR